MTQEKVNPREEVKSSDDTQKQLILFNDEFNTFDFVIETLVEVCGHDIEQAEQCAMIAHYKGKCGVKTGSLIELEPMSKEMTNRKLTVSIL